MKRSYRKRYIFHQNYHSFSARNVLNTIKVKTELIIYLQKWTSRKLLGSVMVSDIGDVISYKYTLQGMYSIATIERSKVAVTKGE